MSEYTYKDVIIDPEDPRVEIGKEYFYGDTPRNVITRANHKDAIAYLANLEAVDVDRGFYIDDFHHQCLIRKEDRSYVERQAEWVEKVGLKSGDEVRILRKFDECEQGFHCGMNPEGEMDSLVGKVLTVKDVENEMIRVYNEDKTVTWVWPYFVLEKVWDAHRPMYTEDDIISDPFDKRVMAALCEEVYRGDDEEEVLDAANNGDKSKMGFLCEARIATDGNPYLIGLNWRYIIIPKIMPEGKPGDQSKEKPEEEYVPFDLSKEEDRDALRGKWVRDSRWGHEWIVEGFFIDEATGAGYKAKLSRKKAGFNGEQLLERYVFLNGSPVGKPANGQQMD